MGICRGGALADQLAVNVPDLKAAVAFYGRQPEAAHHAFHNDTSAARYNEAAAKLACKRTLHFYAKHLK